MTARIKRRSFHVVIVGGEFGDFYAAQGSKDAPVQVTLIDKRNLRLFQPLLYQAVSGDLSPGDIASLYGPGSVTQPLT